LGSGVYRVALPNGHQLLARVPKRVLAALRTVSTGDKVAVEMSPYDLSKGWITERTTLNYESARLSEAAVRELQDHQTQRRDSCHLHELTP
jgi:translation initiation factor IF-1